MAGFFIINHISFFSDQPFWVVMDGTPCGATSPPDTLHTFDGSLPHNPPFPILAYSHISRSDCCSIEAEPVSAHREPPHSNDGCSSRHAWQVPSHRGYGGRHRYSLPTNVRCSSAIYFAAAEIFASGSYRRLRDTPRWSAVPGIICIRPFAPANDTALGSNVDS